jgi:penicillin-binding protein 2
VSTFAVLRDEVVNPNAIMVYCTGALRFGNRVFHCWRPEGHGAMNLHTGMVQSCDVYFYKIGEILDADALASAARALGFGEKTGIDLPGEVQSLIPDRAFYDQRFGKGRWTQGYVLNNVIGQGETLVNLLHVVRMSAAVANGGYLVRPHVVRSIGGAPPPAETPRPVPGMTEETLAFLRRAMTGVVQEPGGTAYWTRINGLPVAGKTGTAQNPHGEDHSWYTAYAPADNPEIAIAVLIENAGHGSEFAAPVAKEFFMEYFRAALAERRQVSRPAAGEAVAERATVAGREEGAR